MKLHTKQNVVEKSGLKEEAGFSIEASAKAFFILSDGLYSNKVKAVVRELSTNAYDSHVDAGVADKPFDVHVPTRLEPTFYVRDYGTSMSHEDCMQLYTTYFRSTRSDSNDAVGCLGLGSKAPFAYVDSFTVEAYLNGNRRLYTAYKDESGIPVFSLMDEGETEEPNGIKVSMSVDSYDVWDFRREAAEIFKFFKVRPNFVGGEVDFEDGAVTLSGDNWEFERGSHNNYLIMGQIAYPIDEDQIKDEVASKFLYSSSGLNIYANIGDVDITPSRESLSYNSATKAKIVEIINEIGLEIATSMEEQIADQDSLFAARVKYIELSDQCDSVSVAMKALDTNLSWNGQDLFNNMMGSAIETGELHVTSYHKTSWRKKIDVTHGVEKIHMHTDTKYVVDDLPRGGISRIRKYINDNCENASIFVASDENAEAFYELLGGATEEDIILTSNLPKREYYRSGGGGGGGSIPAQVYDHDEGHFVSCKMSVKYEDAFYLEEARGEVRIEGDRQVGEYDEGYGCSLQIHSVSKMIETLTRMGSDLSDKNFYLVKPSVIRNSGLAHRDNWSDGCPVLRDATEEVMNDNLDNIRKVITKPELGRDASSRYAEVIRMTKSDSEIKQLVSEYDACVEEVDAVKHDVAAIRTLMSYFELKVDTDEAAKKMDRFEGSYDKLMERYPMFNEMSSYYMDEDTKQNCANYIDLVENSVDK